jgi:hypothetical protein
MKYGVELTSGGMVCIPSYMTVSSGILRFSSVAITDGMDL